jgi:hypothetical protein
MLAAVSGAAMPKFTNTSRLFALCERDELKVIRVVNKTANITNGHVLVRRFVDVPDGVYNVSREGFLVPTTYEHGLRYPDVDMIRPPFERTRPLCEIPHAWLGEFITLCQEVEKVDGLVAMNATHIFMVQNTALNLAFPFGLPHEVRVDPRYLAIALVEMLQYTSVYLLQEQSPANNKPLILGKDWGSCALVMARGSAYG